MNEKIVAELIKFGKALAADKLSGLGDTLSVMTADSMYITAADKPVDKLTVDDVSVIPNTEAVSGIAGIHRVIYAMRKDLRAVVTTHAPYSRIVADGAKKLPACLDDMAQIIGPSAKVADYDDPYKIAKAVQGRNGCFVGGLGAIAGGRTLDEAHTAALVLEKGAKAYVEATVIGKAVKINFFEAKLMQTVYKLKYSKADQTAKMKEAE